MDKTGRFATTCDSCRRVREVLSLLRVRREIRIRAAGHRRFAWPLVGSILVCPVGGVRSMADLPPIECGEIVYRALSRAADRNPDTGEPISVAFIRRAAPRDANGLSINHNCDSEYCRNSLRKCYGVVSLHAGRVRSLGLDVIPDEPQPGNITGLPRLEEDEVQAERLASALVKEARLVRPPQASA
jgi:hypothetical protein